jgi:hypothetical protein
MIVSRPEQQPYEPIPDGLQAAVLVNHFDLGFQAAFINENPKHKVALLWELAARRADGTRFTVAKEYTAILSDTAFLRQALESWRGLPLTEEELKSFELGYLHGTPCTLDLQRKLKRNGRDTFVDVVGVYRARKGDPLLTVETPDTFMPEWVAQKMADALPASSAAEFADEFVGDQPF